MSWIAHDALFHARILGSLPVEHSVLFSKENTYMLFIGIDIASQKHDCCILDESKKELASFSFPNTSLGFQSFLCEVSQFASPENARVGLEATGVYGDNLICFLRQNGFEACTFNPLVVKNRHSGTTLRKTKTDVTDARFLAHLVSSEDFQPNQDISYHTSELKSLSRARFQLVSQRSAIKNKLKALLVVLFPEFSSCFSDVFGCSALSVLEQFPSAKDIAGCSVSSLSKLLRKASRGRLGKGRAEALIEAANNSVGTYSAAKAMQVRLFAEQIRLFNKHEAFYNKEIEKELALTETTLSSVPGIGPTLAAMILGEIGSIDRFASPAKLLAFAGLEPSIYQSGKFHPSSGSMVKRGSPYLRYALMQAARLSSIHDPCLHAYFQKKIDEGKPYTVAISHVAKKIVRIIFSLLMNNSVYSLNYSPLAA